MITRFITNVSTKFNPFSKCSKTIRSFLAMLPATAQRTMKINTTILPKLSNEASILHLKFSMYSPGKPSYTGSVLKAFPIEDGKEMTLDAENMGIKDVMEEVNRHSRILSRQ